MKKSDRTNEILELPFEVGHISTIRSKPTNHVPPRTHDWKIFLRLSHDKANLNGLIQRCVFHLHQDFANVKQEFTSTPFEIQECGYGGFPIPIDIFFKGKKTSKKYSIMYDLDLHQNVPGQPFRRSNTVCRSYSYRFSNPDSDLRAKILEAGGKIVDSGPIPSSHDDEQKKGEISSMPQSNQRINSTKKRPGSPSVNETLTKKKKNEPIINNETTKTLKVPIKTVKPNKTVVPAKRMPTASPNKSSVVPETKSNKILSVKEQKSPSTENTKKPETKPRLSVKLIKTETNNEVKISVADKKKNEQISSTKKLKTVPPTSSTVSKPVAKKTIKAPVKTLPTSSSTVKSSPQNPIRPQTSSSVEKITKKLVSPPKIDEIQSQPTIKPKPLIKSQSTISKERSNFSSENKKKISEKSDSTNLSLKSNELSTHLDSSSFETSLNSSIILPQSPMNLSVSTSNSPSNEQLEEIDNSIIESDQIQLSDDSNDHHSLPSIKQNIPSDKMFSSESSDDDDDDNELPTGLTNDDLRSKLIFIYQRFQRNSNEDLSIFVRFFQRHRLIDPTSLTTNKTTDPMFTYDLFALSASHIGELAKDLGYSRKQ